MPPPSPFQYLTTMAFVRRCSRISSRMVVGLSTKLVSPVRMFSTPTPTSEDMMPFYCLGVSVATQVGGELKGLLEKKEIDAVLAGFHATMLDELTEHDKSLMQIYGPKISALLQDRAKNAVGNEKKKGSGKFTSLSFIYVL